MRRSLALAAAALLLASGLAAPAEARQHNNGVKREDTERRPTRDHEYVIGYDRADGRHVLSYQRDKREGAEAGRKKQDADGDQPKGEKTESSQGE